MKSMLESTRLLSLAGVALGMLSLTHCADARPYASCLTNNAGVISFRLNESADNVKIIWNGGAATNDLGALAQGLTVTANLGITGPFKVQVAKAGGAGYLQGVVNQISDDANNFVKFTNQRGLVVNKNAAGPYFGRIYVGVGSAGTAGGRSVSDGIYLLNADQTDAVGQGNTPRTGGLAFDVGGASGESPGKLTLGPDDSLYISDWSDTSGGITMTDADVATNATAARVLFGYGGPSVVTNTHGSVSSAWVEGSLATGNLTLYTQDEDLDAGDGVYRYDIGAGPLPFTGAPTQIFRFGLPFHGILTKIVRSTDGKWFGSNYRADNATAAGIYAMDSAGAPVWDSITAWRTFKDSSGAYDDYFSNVRGFDVSPDGKYLAAFKGATNIAYGLSANTVVIVPMNDGVPNITNLVAMRTAPNVAIGRELTFDAAGNIYTVSSGQGVLRIYAPGGYATTTTGSDGTFQVYTPAVDVSVTAADAVISEGGGATQFVFSRPSLDLSQSLAVNFQISGTATTGSDYVLKTNGVILSGTRVIIPAGASSVNVTVEATEDALVETTEFVSVTVTASQAYTVGTPSVATVAIADNEPSTIVLSAVYPSMYEGNLFDYAQILLTRLGDTNTFVFVSGADFTFSGTAQSGVDFQPNLSGPDPLNFGQTTVTYVIANPLQDALSEGPETFTVGLNSGFGFVAATNTVVCTIVDDEVAPGPIAYAENFNNPANSNLWNLKFAARNGLADYSADFGYDYTALGVPASPNGGGDTLGLRLTVNKTEASALGGAGINLYPAGQSFSGDYAVRFDMYLIQNAGCAGTTEYAMFGINHSGNQTNWFRYSGDGSPGYGMDGLFYQVEADGANLGDYVLNSSPATTNAGIVAPTSLGERSAAAFEGTFKSPPYSAWGAPGNPNSSGTPSWVQVEIANIGGVVTLKLNNTVIMTTTNTTAYQSGNLMLGYDDAYDSIGCNGGVIYDNLRVISYAPFKITQVAVTGGNVELSFSDSTSGPYTVEASTTVDGSYSPVAATITGSGGSYLAKVPYSPADPLKFFRIKR
jgi:hypothetical protein